MWALRYAKPFFVNLEIKIMEKKLRQKLNEAAKYIKEKSSIDNETTKEALEKLNEVDKLIDQRTGKYTPLWFLFVAVCSFIVGYVAG